MSWFRPQEDQGLVEKILGRIRETTGGLAERGADTLNRFVETLAVMIVTSCLIPILVLLCFLWVIKQLTGVDFRDYSLRGTQSARQRGRAPP